MIARLGRLLQAAGPRGVLRRRALLRRLQGEPRLRPARRSRPPARPGRASSSCATPTAARMPERGRRGRRRQPRAAVDVPLGIHSHNDCDLAVANSLAAVRRRGRRRCRARSTASASAAATSTWSASIANLALKNGYDVLRPGSLRTADRAVALRLRDRQHELPHRPAVRRRQRLRPQGRHARPRRRQGRRPATSTSTRRWSATSGAILVSELSGQSNILAKTAKYASEPRQGADGRRS